MSNSGLVSLCAAGLLMAVGPVARRQFGSALAPSAFLATYWGAILIATLVLAPDFYFWWGAAWIILAFGVVVHLGALVGWTIAPAALMPVRASRARRYRLAGGLGILVACAAIASAAIPVILASRGFGIGDLLSPARVGEMARDFSVGRYQEGYDAPLSARLLTSAGFAGAAFAGVWLATERGLRRALAGLPFVPLLVQTVLLTTRATLVFPTLLCLATLCATLVLRRVDVRLASPRAIVMGTGAAALALSVFLGLQVLRDAEAFDAWRLAWNKARVSFLGSPAVFSRWFEREWAYDQPPQWGAYDVAGVFDLVGLAPRAQGLYVDAIPVGPLGETSNVYTNFRAVIDDFTLLGAIVVYFAIGIAAGFAHRGVAAGARALVPCLATFYAFVLSSPLTSVFNYNTIVLAWGLFAAAVWSRRILRDAPGADAAAPEERPEQP